MTLVFYSENECNEMRSYPDFTFQNGMPCQYNFLHKVSVSERPDCRSQEQLWRNLAFLYLLPPWPIPYTFPFFWFHFCSLPSQFCLIPITFHGLPTSRIPPLLLLVKFITRFFTAFQQLLQFFWTTYRLPEPFVPIILIFFLVLMLSSIFLVLRFFVCLHHHILGIIFIVVVVVISFNPLHYHIFVTGSILVVVVWGITAQLLLL
ncbi:hypothetical protein SDJN02_13612, partial [Cucurbita argyrosperma subsp. argyrosperma]